MESTETGQPIATTNSNKPQIRMKKRKTLMAAVAGLAVTACLTGTAGPITVIDVSTAGSAPNQNANGALFSFADPRPTGTGFIDPFLREQNNVTEAGVNTSIKAQIMNTISD